MHALEYACGDQRHSSMCVPMAHKRRAAAGQLLSFVYQVFGQRII